jgi:hypothetical protein
MRTFKNFFKNLNEFLEFIKNIHIIQCPYCGRYGVLILNGPVIRKYSEDDDYLHQGQRVICNHRKKYNQGCGRGFTLFFSNVLKRLPIRAQTFWRVLSVLSKNNKPLDYISAPIKGYTLRSLKGIENIFSRNLIHIKTYLCRIMAPPYMNNETRHEIQVIEHLKTAFPQSACPIADFQAFFQVSFIK